MKFEGRSLTVKERKEITQVAPDGTVLIVYGVIRKGNRWLPCLRFFDKDNNLLDKVLYLK